MIAEELDDLRAYRDTLLAYSTQEVEDVYFHIDILKYPLRYKLLQIELQRRRLTPLAEKRAPIRPCLASWLATWPRLARRPPLLAAVLAISLAFIVALIALAILAPVWLFAVPWDFRGVQAALVYVGYAPVAPVVAASIGRRMGGHGWFAVPVLLGIALGLLLFNLTGVPALIVRDLLTSGSGGSGFSFGY